MQIKKLVEKLKNVPVCRTIIRQEDEEIYHCCLFEDTVFQDTGNKLGIEPNTLYLCTARQLKELSLQQLEGITASFLCLQDSSVSEPYFFSNINIVEVSETEKNEYIPAEEKTAQGKLKSIQAQINHILACENRLSAHMYQIIKILHANRGLQALVDAAYDILGNPLLVVDTSYKILASCQNVIYARDDLNVQIDLGYMLEKNIVDMKKARLYEKAREAHYPYYSKDKGARDGWITALIYVHGIETAHIAVTDTNRPFSEEDFEFIDVLCRIVSLELQKSDFYQTNKSLMHSFFLSELLDNHFCDMETIHRRAQSLNWIRTDYLRIMIICEHSMVLFDKKAQLISQFMTMMFPVCHWVIYEGYLVFLIGTDEPSLNKFRCNEHLETFLTANHLTASISRCFHSLIDTRRFYDEALTAFRLGQQFHPEHAIYVYSDYICQHIGDILSQYSNVMNFCHPAVEKIREYDAEHDSHLLDTLKEYLTYPDNPGQAAKHLFIHKNTLFYRMAKIKELFSLNLSNGEERLLLHLSLKFMELNGR